jgi:hypothetical protein
MTDPSQVALARAFVGVSYLLGARGSELVARQPVDAAGTRLANELGSQDPAVRARVVAHAVLDVGRDLDRRRVE